MDPENMYSHRLPLRLVSLVLAALSSLAGASAARAEINIGESIEWLSAKADRVVVGKIGKLQPDSGKGVGKSQNLVLFTLKAQETLKGDGPQPVYCIGVRDIEAAVLAAYQKQGAELLLFLDQTEQATSFDGLTCNLWPLRNEGDSVPYLVALGDPRKRMLSATNFQVLKDRNTILSACRDALRRLAARPGPGKPQRHLLEVPFDSEVHQVLYSGSACYLYTPAGLFPKAKAGFR